MEKIGVSLSYWESLILIEELKGWYNIDLDLGEGVVSASTVEVWMKSVCQRNKSLTTSEVHETSMDNQAEQIIYNAHQPAKSVHMYS